MYSENKKKFLIFFFKPFSLLAHESFQPKSPKSGNRPSFLPPGRRDPLYFRSPASPAHQPAVGPRGAHLGPTARQQGNGRRRRTLGVRARGSSASAPI
jgi:hypothetical protein